MDASLVALLLPVLGPILAMVATGFGTIRFVQENERGVKLRFGRAIRRSDGNPRIYKPGFALVIPALHSLKRIHIKTQTLELQPQRVMLADHTVFTVGALVITHVIDSAAAIYAALFEVDDVKESVETYCAAALRDVLQSTKYPELADPEALARRVREHVEPRLREWGIQVEDVKLTDCSPSSETARMILIATETTFRVEALKAASTELAEATHHLPATLAAALIGTPVSVALTDAAGAGTNGKVDSRPARRVVNATLQIGGRSPMTGTQEED